MELPGLQLPAVVPYWTGEDFEKWTRGLGRYFAAGSVTDAGRKCTMLSGTSGTDDISGSLPGDDLGATILTNLKAHCVLQCIKL